MGRLTHGLQFFSQHYLPVFEVGDLLFVRRDHRRIVRLHDARQHPVGLPGEVAQQLSRVRLRRRGLDETLVPRILEHGVRDGHQALARLQAGDNLVELALDPIARDRLARAGTVAVVAEVVGMPLAGAASRPTRRERVAAVAALDEAAQREIDADLLLDRSPGALVEPRLDALVGLDRDQRLVVPLTARDVPLLRLDAAGIDRTTEARCPTWAEIDRSARMWTIPEHRMKGGAPHLVPLSDAALNVLDRVKRRQGCDFVFVAQGTEPVTETSLRNLLREFGYDKRAASLHGFRSSMRDWMTVRGIDDAVAEAAIAHYSKAALGTLAGSGASIATMKAYKRTTYYDARVGVMKDWDYFLRFY